MNATKNQFQTYLALSPPLGVGKSPVYSELRLQKDQNMAAIDLKLKVIERIKAIEEALRK